MNAAVSPAIADRYLSPRNERRGRLPLLIAITTYTATTAAILFASYRMASGHFIYPLDDPYINMAMAKNLALHGVWGVSPYEFSSSTSSPFFMLLLSLIYRLTGPNQFVPLALSWVFGLCSIYVAWQIVTEYLSAAWQAAALVAVVLFAPLFVVGTLGMEHSLHVLLTLLFLKHFDADENSILPLALVTFAMTATRYEGLFVAAVGFLVLAVQKRGARAATVAVFAWLPVLLYAFFSIHHHGYWLPNSVALKGAQAHGAVAATVESALVNFLKNFVLAPHLSSLAAALVITALSIRKFHPKLANMVGVVGGAACLHLVFADVGWSFRYEDYLIASGVLVLACALPELRTACDQRFVREFSYILILAGVLLTGRSLVAGWSVPKYSRAIYQQQWQTASFLRTYYPGAAVAANDIGAIDFRTDLRLLDLEGLANADIFAAKRAGLYSTQLIDEEAKKRGIEIAVIYDSWFSLHPRSPFGGPPVPSSWIRVRRWQVPLREQLGDNTVSFYALTAEEAKRLDTRLHRFEATLPKDIIVMDH
jgi:hypothetical protein